MEMKVAYIVVTIKPDGSQTVTEHAKSPKLSVFQNIVGEGVASGYVQEVPYFTKLLVGDTEYRRGTAYCNEDSAALGLPSNPKASQLWRIACPDGQPSRMRLHGNVVFCAKIAGS
jgi:hypothetical protein